MPEQDELDLLVQSALASYADPGAESGLEGRILARIAAEGAPVARRRWLPWAIALPVAAGLLLLLLLSGHRQKVPQFGQQFQVPSAPQSEVADAGKGTPTVHYPTRKKNSGEGLSPQRIRESAHAAKDVPSPKREVFPTPQPLSPEELALAEFGASATETERQTFIEAQKQNDAPLTIAAIEIKPLDPPDHGGN